MKSGVEALRIAPNPTGSVSTAIEMSVNGMAENAAPAMANARRFCRAIGQVRRPKIASRMSAPIAIRISAVQTAPTSTDAMCMNRNAPPQTAPRKRSWARWARVTGRSGATDAVMGWVSDRERGRPAGT